MHIFKIARLELGATQILELSSCGRVYLPVALLHLHFGKNRILGSLRCRAIKRQTKGSAPKLTNFEIDVGPGSGTLMKPKNHSMGVGGLLVQELEPGKDLKAEKG